jgi:hypothetical protein
MTLTDLISQIDNVDENLVIFIESMTDFNAAIVLEYEEEGDNGVKYADGKQYKYLIEVFLAKEFVDDWKPSLEHHPTDSEIAKRLFEYAINDA